MNTNNKIIKLLENTTGNSFTPADTKANQILMEINTPKEITLFYNSINPADTVINGIRLLSAESFIEENTELMPGCYSAPLGYFAIAANEYGNTFCWNLNKNNLPEIVSVSHEDVYEDTTAEDMQEIAEPIADNLFSFIQKIIENDLDRH